MNSMSGEKLKGIPYTGTLPAVITGTKAGYLQRYKVYGNVGENLFDNAATNTNNGYVPSHFLMSDGTTAANSNYSISEYIPISPSTIYTVKWYAQAPSSATSASICFYDDSKVYISGVAYSRNNVITLTSPPNALYARISTHNNFVNQTMVTKGSTDPSSYIPYEECGERTENLFNGELLEGTWTSAAMNYRQSLGAVYRSMKLTLSSGIYTLVFSENVYFVRKIVNGVYSEPNTNISNMTFTVETLSDVGFSFRMASSPQTPWNNNVLISVNEGSTLLPYEPYGYKLSLTSGSTPVDIYIGDDTLSTEEYIDSGTGKVYRMVSGTLTPVDPPVPFPQIPTSANSTTISWAGEGLAPSQFDSVQEWVDIPTYTYTNGEWVADN